MKRPLPWILLGVALALSVILIPHHKSPSERADHAIEQWQAKRLPLTHTASRHDMISLFLQLERAGEERRMAQLAPIFLDDHFTKEEIQTVAVAAYSLFRKWNDAPHAWRWDLYQKLMSMPGDHAEGPYCVLHSERTQVEIRFYAKNDFQQLYLAGDWTSSGRLAQFRGFSPQKLVNTGQDEWSLRFPMQKNPYSHAYHGVVRTAPWPAGRAVGWTSFRLSGERSRVIEIREQTVRPSPPLPTLSPIEHRSRLLLLGIDGASWHVLLPLIQRGVLPHWSRLLQEGTAVRLTADGGRFAYSSLPSIHTAMSGYLPARHQTKKEFFGFSIRPAISRIWNIASDQGLRVGTVGVWGTFPVEKIHGAIISEAFFFFRALDNPLLKEILYSPWTVNFAESFGIQVSDFDRLLRFARWARPYVDSTYPARLTPLLDAILPPLRLSTKSDIATLTRLTYDECIYQVTRYLLQQNAYDLMVNYLIDVDSRSHISWQQFEPLGHNPPEPPSSLSEAGNDLVRSYQRTDQYLGEMMTTFEHIMIFSDHGMGSIPSDHYHPFILMDSDKLAAHFKKMDPQGLPVEFTLTQLSKYDYRLDSPSSETAITPLIGFLASMTLKSSGETLFEVTPLNTSALPKKFLVRIRARFDKMEDRIQIGDKHVGLSDLFFVRAIAADHGGNGVMALWGRGIRPGVRIEDAYEEDVAATALYLLDVPISKQMDGRPLVQAIQNDYLAAHPVKWVRKAAAPPSSIASILRSIRWKRLLSLEWMRRTAP